MTETFNAAEKYQSQVPALQLLVALGFTPLSQEEALRQRGGRLRSVLLEDILSDQLLELNSYRFRGKEYPFDLTDAHEAIRKLTPTPERMTGLQGTSQQVYDTLLLGTTISKTIAGDTKSHTMNYIDWDNPGNNVYHVTAELSVARTGSTATKRCDIVAYVNGIPFIVIENKRPTESVEKAGSQLIGYQNADKIPHLFHYAGLLLAMNRHEARYATVGTPHKFWSTWTEEGAVEADVAAAANAPLTDEQKRALFSGRFAPARRYFDELAAAGPRAISEQDRLIHALCRPERLLDLVRRFTVFDGGVRKIARHQQYFAVRAAIERVRMRDANGTRRGGVIWHTQGSGKSLTMVMLAKALALDPGVKDQRVVLVTDRDDLDKQIRDTFVACELDPKRAQNGSHLAKLLSDGAPLITTIVNKFENAAKRTVVDDSDNVFVLVDESHRSQTGRYGGYGQFHVAMRRMLPRACFIGFTGTPLLAREKSTVATFGGIIHRYTIDEAVHDGAVVPLLYEGRDVEPHLANDVIDQWFEKLSEGLTDEQKRDLKRKFSRIDVLGRTAQVIHAKAWDISEHYRKNWQGTGFKAQLVAPTKASAIRFKQVLDEIGHVTSEVVISAPTDNEGNEEVDRESRDLVKGFWDERMQRYGSETAYNNSVIEAFKGSGDPEILIVVSKLLTGFDAPRNTVLYLCKSLKEHTLLQAIARVNRLFEEEAEQANDDGAIAALESITKEFGYIIDYQGLLGELDEALTAYGALAGYDDDDLTGAVHDVREQIRQLPGRSAAVWDVFKQVPNKKDMESLEQHLADDASRHDFYALFRAFAKTLRIALGSDKLADVIDAQTLGRYTNDWKQFRELKRLAQIRNQEIVDLHDYEPKIQQLLDQHVTALPAKPHIALFDIHDTEALKAVVADSGFSTASRADRIASAVKRTISERMDEDPALYRRFSAMLQDAIDGYRRRREAEKDLVRQAQLDQEYLDRVQKIAEDLALGNRGTQLPASIRRDEAASAIFGELEGMLVDANSDADGAVDGEELAGIATAILSLVTSHLRVGMWSNEDAKNQLKTALDDFFWDDLADRHLDLPPTLVDELQARILRIAQARFPR